MDVERLIKLGAQQLSLSGNELRVWVEATLKEEAMKKEAERKLVIEDREKERKLVIEDREREAQIRAMEIAAEQSMLDKQLELERLRLQRQGNPAEEKPMTSVPFVGIKTPKLPHFDEGKDDIGSYLVRFENFVQLNNWPKEQWALHLCTLLTGKALDVYTRMPVSDAKEYSKLRDALLLRFNLTEDGFANKFRTSKPEQGERMEQFKTRISSYMYKWLELAGKDVTNPNDIMDIFLKEQLLAVCSKELKTFVKERKPKTSTDVVEICETFIDAHGIAGAFSRQQSHPVHTTKSHDTALGPERVKTTVTGKNQCHRCLKFGHFARDCRAPNTASTRRQVSAVINTPSETVCSYCNRKGHSIEKCWERKRVMREESEQHGRSAEGTDGKCCGHTKMELKCGCALPVISAAGLTQDHTSTNMPVAIGWVNGQRVSVLRDSGCSCIVIRKGLVSSDDTHGKVMVHLADGTTVFTPLTEFELKSPYYSGKVVAAEMETPLYDVIIGNIPGAKCPGIQLEETQKVAGMETRSSKDKKIKALLTPIASNVDITVKDLIKKQLEDDSLHQCRRMAENGDIRRTGKNNKTWYVFEHGILYRYFETDKLNDNDGYKQVVLPKELRPTVMKIAHESILAGHLAAKKTTDRILQDFFWPNVWTDVSRFCQSCDSCQRSTPRGRTPKVPLTEFPLIDEPFKRVAVDLVGPIVPASERGNKYILTVVDYCTRYPEAIALKRIDTETVAEALVDIYSRVGIPKEVLSDCGSQFTSDLMKEVCRLLSMRQLITTPYHPQCNGLVERFNATLKGMLKRLASDRPKDWDRYLNAALFAYREAPQESLGFSPFELLYARPVRGPMSILRELWTNDIQDDEIKTTYQYVVDLREKMEKVIELAQENLKTSSTRYKAYFDKKAKQRTFGNGDKVLLLLPTKHNKLELKWQGPFNVIKRKGPNNYVVDTGLTTKTYHANMLKRYYEQEVRTNVAEVGIMQCAVAAVVTEDDNEENTESYRNSIELPNLSQKETFTDVHISDTLNEEQMRQLNELLGEYDDVMTDVPGRTNLCEYDIKLTSEDPIRKKPYPVPHALKETMREEVKTMLDARIIEPSDSSYCSPSVIVKKKDGTNRYCVDYRALNNVTVFDAEPMPRIDDLFEQIGPDCRYLSRFDLSKGYWQIPLSTESKPKTAFATEFGLMQFTVLPFGLQGAPATFSRLMRKVLHGMPNIKSYIDDILVHHSNWKDHLEGIKSVLERLREAGLTARPTKCLIGFPQVEFLGHQIGSGTISPLPDKVKAIQDAKPPQTKKQMRSFLGLASFYRRYVPNFSALVSPLSDTTKNGMPTRIQWQEPQERAFNYIKKVLTSEPVLRLPDFDRPFVLATDASDTGIGAILIQEHDGEKFPLMYLSRKLLPREKNYSVVEKECLALVWAIQRLNTYLIGREFIVETDHGPLLYLNRARTENGRLMRWALLLSQYRFTLRSVKGSENHGPDFLSRLD